LQTCGDDRRISPPLGGGIGTRKPGTLRSAPANICTDDCGDVHDEEENAASAIQRISAAQKKPSMTRVAAPAIAHHPITFTAVSFQLSRVVHARTFAFDSLANHWSTQP
jgi:hypothetical protein